MTHECVGFAEASGGTQPCGNVVKKAGGWCGNCVGSELHFRKRLDVTSAFARGGSPLYAPDPAKHKAVFQAGVTHPDPRARETTAMHCDARLLTLDVRRLLLDDAEAAVRETVFRRAGIALTENELVEGLTDPSVGVAHSAARCLDGGPDSVVSDTALIRLRKLARGHWSPVVNDVLWRELDVETADRDYTYPLGGEAWLALVGDPRPASEMLADIDDAELNSGRERLIGAMTPSVNAWGSVAGIERWAAKLADLMSAAAALTAVGCAGPLNAPHSPRGDDTWDTFWLRASGLARLSINFASALDRANPTTSPAVSHAAGALQTAAAGCAAVCSHLVEVAGPTQSALRQGLCAAAWKCMHWIKQSSCSAQPQDGIDSGYVSNAAERHAAETWAEMLRCLARYEPHDLAERIVGVRPHMKATKSDLLGFDWATPDGLLADIARIMNDAPGGGVVDSDTAGALLAHPRAGPALARSLLRVRRPTVRAQVVRADTVRIRTNSPRLLTDSDLTDLVRNGRRTSRHVASAVSRSPAAPPESLTRLAGHDPDIQEYVAGHPHTPQATRALLAFSSHKSVAEAAAAGLRASRAQRSKQAA